MVLKEHSEPDLNIQSADSKFGQSEKTDPVQETTFLA
jgi:hypothetical protein